MGVTRLHLEKQIKNFQESHLNKLDSLKAIQIVLKERHTIRNER